MGWTVEGKINRRDALSGREGGMKQEDIRFLIITAIFCLALFGAASLLTGCSEMKYAECIARDSTRNPCN